MISAPANLSSNCERDRRRDVASGPVPPEELRRHLGRQEMIGRHGKQVVSIPIPHLELPRFAHDTGGKGVGQGDGEGEGGEGNKAGNAPGRHLLEAEFTIEELVSELRRPRAPRHASGMNVRNSTWQNLYLKRDQIENDFFHGPIIELGGKYDIPVPYNKTALALVQECHRKQLGPGSYRLSDVLKAVEDGTQS